MEAAGLPSKSVNGFDAASNTKRFFTSGFQTPRAGIAEHFDHYNNRRGHQSLGYNYPADIYHQKTNINGERVPPQEANYGVRETPGSGLVKRFK